MSLSNTNAVSGGEYTATHAAKYLNMRPDQLRRFANEGRILCHRKPDPCWPLGVRVFKQEDLDAYVAGKVARLVKALQRLQPAPRPVEEVA